MPNEARYLDDQRIHIVDSPQFRPFCELALEPGLCIVIAGGTVSRAELATTWSHSGPSAGLSGLISTE